MKEQVTNYKAILKNVRISPQKARLVADLIRKKPVIIAVDKLRMLNKKASRLILKVLNSAIANATYKSTVDVDRLIVYDIRVDEGFKLKRYIPRAQGRATPILKRTSHISIKLIEQ